MAYRAVDETRTHDLRITRNARDPLDGNVKSYLLDCAARNLRPATITTYRLQLAAFSKYAADVGVTSLADIDVEFLRGYFAASLHRGLSAASVRTAARTLRVFMTWCAAEELIDGSPMRRVRLPKLDTPRPDAFTVEEVRKLLDTATSTRDQALILFLLDTGARLGETAALRLRDVDLSTGRIWLQTQTKSRRPRSVFLGQTALHALMVYLAECPAEGDAPLWRTVKRNGGGGLTWQGLQEVIKRMGRRAGVHPCAPHKFRRTFALWSLRAGIDVVSLTKLMGHTSAELLRYYISLNDADLRAAHSAHGAVDKLLR